MWVSCVCGVGVNGCAGDSAEGVVDVPLGHAGRVLVEDEMDGFGEEG